MPVKDTSYKHKKVISIGDISKITGITERQIRYYEEKELIFPGRTEKGTRKYSFNDIEKLMDIIEKREDGVRTIEIREDMLRTQ